MILAAEMGTFCVLVAPLPYAVRKKFFNFLSESPLVAKLAYGLKITFMCVLHSSVHEAIQLIASRSFIGILFIDALQRMWRVTAEADIARNQGSTMHDARAETNFAARKF